MRQGLGGNLDKAKELREVNIATRVLVDVLVRGHLEGPYKLPVLLNLHPQSSMPFKVHFLQRLVDVKDVAEERQLRVQNAI